MKNTSIPVLLFLLCLGTMIHYAKAGATQGQTSDTLRTIRTRLEKKDTSGTWLSIQNTQRQISPSKDSIALFLLHICRGSYLFEKSDTENSFSELYQALSIARQLDADTMIADACYTIGQNHYSIGNYVIALRNLTEALPVLERSHKEEKVARINRMCGVMHLTLGSSKESRVFFEKALAYYEEKNDEYNMGALLNNIGFSYMNQSDSVKAMDYFTKSFAVRAKIRDYVGVGQVYTNMGSLMFKFEHYKEALENYQKGYEYRVTHNGPFSGQIESLIFIGKAHFKKGNIPEAIRYLERGLQEGRKNHSAELQKRALETLKDVYASLGDYTKAFAAQEKYYFLKDSLYGREKTEDLIKITVTREYEKQMFEDSLKNAEKDRHDFIVQQEKDKRNSIIRNTLVAGILVVLALAALLFQRNRERKKANAIITSQRDELKMRQDEIHDSISYARRIQQALLPSEKSIRNLLPDSFILFLPKDVVSGDFYWVEKVHNKILFAAADCTGHGVPGALVSVVAHNALDRCVNEFGLISPSEILNRLSKLVEETFSKSENEIQDGLDISLCCFDPAENSLQWSGANNPLWMVRNGKLQEYKPDRQPIGRFYRRLPFTGHTIPLCKGDQIYLFTDGFADQFGGSAGKKFKYRQLQQVLLSQALLPMQEQKNFLEKTFEEWKKGLEQVDDVLIVGARV